MIINIVTHLGDLVVVLPLAVAALAWLAYVGARRLALYWAIALATCLAITIILKMRFLACPSSFFDLRSPSGHASVSMLVYGAWGTIASKAVEGKRRIAIIAATASLIAAIALSRSTLGAHTAMEIVMGLAIGGFALIPFIYACRDAPVRLVPAHFLPLMVVLPFALMADSPDTEKMLGAAAAFLQQVAPMCNEGTPGELAQ